MNRILHDIAPVSEKMIFTCSSEYHVLLSTLLILELGNYDRFYIVMFSPDKKVVKKMQTISEKLSVYGIMSCVIDKKTRLHRALGFSNLQNYKKLKQVLKQLGSSKRKGYFLVNFSWNQQIVRYPASIYLKYARGAIFIEEGAAQYITPAENRFYVLLKKLYGNTTEFWKLNKIKTIYVQNPGKYPEYLRPHLEQFILQFCFVKNKEQAENILMAVFVEEKDRKEILDIKYNHAGIVFTQPFSEDGFMSENRKKEIMSQICDYYSKFSKVYLKVHPRDKTQYHIDNAKILKGNYPSEIFNVLNIEFDFAVAICSSAVETVQAKKKLNLNENYLKEFSFELQPI